MKILLIHQAFATLEESGGTRHYELARHIVQKGHKFTIVASDLSYLTGRPSVERTKFVTEQRLDGIRILRTYTYPALHRSFFWRGVSFISFMLSSIWAAWRSGPTDLVMGTSPPIFQAVSAWFVAALRRRPFLLEVRDLWPEFAIGLGVLTNPVLIALSRRLERFLYARASHIMVNSPAYREYLVELGIPPRKVTVIPNGVSTDMFDPDAKGDSIRRELGLDDQFTVTYAGALGMANDIATILRAADRLRAEEAVRFVLAGDGKERTNLEKQAAEMGLKNVTFAGALPKTRMPELLAATDVCVATLKDIPMFRMTYPNKVFDYMAAGRPTALAIDGVIREVVEAARGGIFVPPGDDEALAEAILRLSRNREQAKEMGRAARNYVRQEFDRSKQAEQFLLLLQRLARRKRR